MTKNQVKSNQIFLKRVLIGISIAGNIMFLLIILGVWSGALDRAIDTYAQDKFYTSRSSTDLSTRCFTGYAFERMPRDSQGHWVSDTGKILCIKGVEADPVW